MLLVVAMLSKNRNTVVIRSTDGNTLNSSGLLMYTETNRITSELDKDMARAISRMSVGRGNTIMDNVATMAMAITISGVPYLRSQFVPPSFVLLGTEVIATNFTFCLVVHGNDIS
jgi:hypothetical protein